METTKKDSNLPEVQKLVDLLSAEDKKKLLDHLALDLRNQKSTKESTRDMDLWESAILESFNKITNGRMIMIPRSSDTWTAFKSSYKDMRDFCESASCSKLNLYLKKSLYRLL